MKVVNKVHGLTLLLLVLPLLMAWSGNIGVTIVHPRDGEVVPPAFTLTWYTSTTISPPPEFLFCEVYLDDSYYTAVPVVPDTEASISMSVDTTGSHTVTVTCSLGQISGSDSVHFQVRSVKVDIIFPQNKIIVRDRTIPIVWTVSEPTECSLYVDNDYKWAGNCSPDVPCYAKTTVFYDGEHTATVKCEGAVPASVHFALDTSNQQTELRILYPKDDDFVDSPVTFQWIYSVYPGGPQPESTTTCVLWINGEEYTQTCPVGSACQKTIPLSPGEKTTLIYCGAFSAADAVGFSVSGQSLPNLTIPSAEYHVTHDALVVDANVCNTGDADANTFVVHFQWVSWGEDEVSVSSLPAGSCVEVNTQFPLESQSMGTQDVEVNRIYVSHVLEVIADYYNTVPESNEQDNNYVLLVPELPNLWAEVLTTKRFGGMLKGYVRVHNTGLEESDATEINIGGVVYPVPGLSAGEYVDVYFYIPAPAPESNLLVVVDPEDNVQEMNEADNELVYLVSNPAVTLIAPEPGSTVEENVTFVWSVEDANSCRCEVYLDGEIIHSTTCLGECSIEYNPTPGTHWWHVACYDVAGNVGISDEWNFTAISENLPNLFIANAQYTLNAHGLVVDANVCNDGNAVAFAVNLLFEFEGNEYHYSAGELAAGECTPAEIQLPVFWSEGDIVITVDPYDNIPELNENDNTYVLHYVPQFADLYAESIRVTPTTVPASGILVDANICNGGTASAENFWVMLVTSTLHQELLSLAPGECIQIDPFYASEYELQPEILLVVDYYNTVIETNEQDNNILIHLFPNLTIAGYAISDGQVDVNICNTGTYPAPAFTVQVGSEAKEVNGLSILACAQETFTLPSTDFMIVVDPENAVEESNEQDNTLFVTIQPDFYWDNVSAERKEENVIITAELCNGGALSGETTATLCLGTNCRSVDVTIDAGACVELNEMFPVDDNLSIYLSVPDDANTSNNTYYLPCVDGEDADASALCCALRAGVYGNGTCCGDEEDEDVPGEENYYFDWDTCSYDYPPRITLLYPVGMAGVYSPVTLRWRVEDEGDVECNLWVDAIEYSFEGTGEKTYQVSLSPGTYSWGIACVDEHDQNARKTDSFVVLASAGGTGGGGGSGYITYPSPSPEEEEEEEKTTTEEEVTAPPAPKKEKEQVVQFYIDPQTGRMIYHPTKGVYYDPVWGIMVLIEDGRRMSLGGGTALLDADGVKTVHVISTWKEYNIFETTLVPPGTFYYADGGEIYLGIDVDGDLTEDFSIVLSNVQHIDDVLHLKVEQRDGYLLPSIEGFEGKAYVVSARPVCVKEVGGTCQEWTTGKVPLTGFVAVGMQETPGLAAIIGAIVVIAIAIYAMLQRGKI